MADHLSEIYKLEKSWHDLIFTIFDKNHLLVFKSENGIEYLKYINFFNKTSDTFKPCKVLFLCLLSQA